jgi:hypothetical protein
LRAELDLQEILARKAFRVTLVQLETQVQLVTLGRLVRKETQAQLATPDRKVISDRLVKLVILDRLAQLGILDRRAILVLRVPLEQLGHKDLLVE